MSNTLTISGIRDCGHIYHVEVSQSTTERRIREQMEAKLKRPCTEC